MDLITILDIIGTIAFALSGYILAARANLDFLGILILSYISAFGGGVIRDLLVDRMPFIFSETYPIAVVFITIIVSFVFKLHRHKSLSNNLIFKLSDSIGLSIFAYTGASIAIHYDFNFGGVIFMALLTSIGGGIISSMMINKTPHILKNEFYGAVSIIIGILVWVIYTINIISIYTTFSIIGLGVILRMLAIQNDWRLPKLV